MKISQKWSKKLDEIYFYLKLDGQTITLVFNLKIVNVVNI